MEPWPREEGQSEFQKKGEEFLAIRIQILEVFEKSKFTKIDF